MGLGQVPGKDQSCGVMRHPHAQGSLCFCPDYKYFPSLSWLGEMVNLGWGSTWGGGLRLRAHPGGGERGKEFLGLCQLPPTSLPFFSCIYSWVHEFIYSLSP